MTDAADDTAQHQIGDVAQKMHLSLRTLRYWEEVGLIAPTDRTAGGFRVYGNEDLERIALIRAMKVADFTIEELRDLVSVVEDFRSQPGPDSVERLQHYVRRVRDRCEIVRARVAEAEVATIRLERLMEETGVPVTRDRG
jgi:DNA-binding transcriptional MerR regulator